MGEEWNKRCLLHFNPILVLFEPSGGALRGSIPNSYFNPILVLFEQEGEEICQKDSETDFNPILVLFEQALPPIYFF